MKSRDESCVCVCVSAALVVSVYRGPWAVRACVMRDGACIVEPCVFLNTIFSRRLRVYGVWCVRRAPYVRGPFVRVRSINALQRASLRNRASSIFVRVRTKPDKSRRSSVRTRQDETRQAYTQDWIYLRGTRTSQVHDQVNRERAKPQATREKRIERKSKG